MNSLAISDLEFCQVAPSTSVLGGVRRVPRVSVNVDTRTSVDIFVDVRGANYTVGLSAATGYAAAISVGDRAYASFRSFAIAG